MCKPTWWETPQTEDRSWLTIGSQAGSKPQLLALQSRPLCHITLRQPSSFRFALNVRAISSSTLRDCFQP